MSALPVLEIPASGPFDETRTEAAPILGIHLPGRRTPLVVIRSWGSEIPGLRLLAGYLGPDQPLYGIAPPSGSHKSDFPSKTRRISGFRRAELQDGTP